MRRIWKLFFALFFAFLVSGFEIFCFGWGLLKVFLFLVSCFDERKEVNNLIF